LVVIDIRKGYDISRYAFRETNFENHWKGVHAMAKMMLLDGNSLVNRAFYALPPLTSAEGLPTNALHGFLTMLFKLQKDHKPDYWVVVFDKSKATVRIEQYAAYKAQRKETPETLKPQFSYLKEILQAMSVPMLELAGYEADDIIATVADKAVESGMEVSIYTGDKDAFQLISPQIKVFLTIKGITEVQCFDENRLAEKYQLKPEQIIHLKGLMGDSSDNIPGIPGVGEKTALKLLHQYGTVENVFIHKDEVNGKKLKSLLDEYEEQALLSKRLATMIHDVPVAYSLDELRWSEPDPESSLKTLQRYSLHAIARLFEQNLAARRDQNGMEVTAETRNQVDKEDRQRQTTQDTQLRTKSPENNNRQTKNVTQQNIADRNVKTSGTETASGPFALADIESEEIEEILLDSGSWMKQMALWQQEKATLTLSYRYEGSHVHRSQWLEMGIFDGKNAYTLNRNEQPTAVIDKWHEILADDRVSKILADSKSLYSLLLNEQEIPFYDNGGNTIDTDTKKRLNRLNGLKLDVSLAAYLLNPNQASYTITELLRDYTTQLFALSVAQEAIHLREIAAQTLKKLAEEGLEELLLKMEQPLSVVLATMEQTGIAVDKSMLLIVGQELEQKLGNLEKEIYEIAGSTFNLNSPQQMGKVLFEDLGLPPKKKTKTGFSTDAETLEELRTQHPIIEKVLEYRQLVKLNSTYVKGLLNQLQDGKIHTTYQQTVTTTGRLSSTEPNLQNIPIRLQEGRKLRKVFTPTREDWVLFSADYSQIELRILAHYSADPILCESFLVGEDVHARTASEVFGVSLAAVDSDMRRKAKAVNFGLMYGLTDFGLARDLAIARKEAKFYITQYFERYSGVQRYLFEVVETARETGEVRTLLNRLRKIPELTHPNRMTQQFGERIAKNTPIQGTAADIMKIAMLKVDEALQGKQAEILLQVHDELLIQVSPEDLDSVALKVKEAMENAYPISVPLVVDCKTGENWYDMTAYTFKETKV